VPVLVERDLILYEPNIINEYIDERFPHPQLMPADPIMRARARQLLVTMEREIFSFIEVIEKNGKTADKARQEIRDRLTEIGTDLQQAEVHAGRRVLHARRGHRAAAVASRPLRHRPRQGRGAADEVRRAHLQPPGLHRRADAVRKGDAQVDFPVFFQVP
jgi:glutathione S-transferase